MLPMAIAVIPQAKQRKKHQPMRLSGIGWVSYMETATNKNRPAA